MSARLQKYREWHWIISKGSAGISEDLRTLPQKIAGEVHHFTGDTDPPWDMNPDYQRGYVWTRRQQELFLGHFVEGGAMPAIYVQRYEGPQNFPSADPDAWLKQPCEVVDGKQRLQAFLDWLSGAVVAEVSCGDRIAWADLTENERRSISMSDLRITYIDLNRKDRLRFYLKLNRGGTIHTDDEIDLVRDLLAKEEGR